MTVAVLFARADSHYKSLPGVEVYDMERDARTYDGLGRSSRTRRAVADGASPTAWHQRWLRDVGDATWRPFGTRTGYSAAQADAAIDAAIAASEEKKGAT